MGNEHIIFWMSRIMDKDKECKRCQRGSRAPVSSRMIREGLSEETYQCGPDDSAGIGHAHIWRECFLQSGNEFTGLR